MSLIASRTEPMSVAGATRPPRTRRIPHGPAFWIVAFAFTTATAFSAMPTPLYALYQARDHFSSFTVTIVFAAYAAGVIASLFLVGHLSDRHGRRRLLLPGLLLEAASAAVFLSSTSLPAILVARVINGLAMGAITATATAHLTELHLEARPGASRTRAELAATAANVGGLGIGPMISGLLAQYAPQPLRVPYLVFLGLVLVAALGVALVPETVDRTTRDAAPYRPQRVSVPAAARPRYLAATGAAFTTFAVLGLFNSLAPSFVAGTMHHRSRTLAGGVALLVFGCAALSQALVSAVTARRQVALGTTLLVAGLVPLTFGVWSASLPAFLAGGAVAGAGAGMLFKGSVSTVVGLAAPQSRGEALAGLFLVAYIGLTVPIVSLGIATQYVAARSALLVFAIAVGVLAVAVSSRLLRQGPDAPAKIS